MTLKKAFAMDNRNIILHSIKCLRHGLNWTDRELEALVKDLVQRTVIPEHGNDPMIEIDDDGHPIFPEEK